MNGYYSITSDDSRFFAYLRSLSIFMIVFGHVGAFWVFPPYSEFLHVFVAVFFFISGVVSAPSLFKNSVPDFYKKRLIGLLVPYYLLSLLLLLYYVINHGTLPTFDWHNLRQWLEIRPSSKISPISIGQVWFLHVLVIIIILSPLLFYIIDRSPNRAIGFLCFVLALSFLQVFLDIDGYFWLFDNNIFQPIIHTFFFTTGLCYLRYRALLNSRFLSCVIGFGILSSITLVLGFGINPDYSFHTYAPDFYYLAGCVVVIAAFIQFKRYLLVVLESNFLIKASLNFFFKHTFSIFLLHSISIYISETVFGLNDSSGWPIGYALSKFSVVIFFTCLLAVPFTFMCDTIKNNLNKTF